MSENVISHISPPPVSMRERLRVYLLHPLVRNAIIALIVINAILLGLETSPTVTAQAGEAIRAVDTAILAIFVMEILLRLYVHRLAFWRDPWSVFDFSVVAIALIPTSGAFAVLRALRVLRVLRLLSMVPAMRRVVGALLGAIPGLMSIGLVLLILFYVFAVIATNLFAADYPQWFGHLGRSFYTLFQIMTLESWSMGIARPIMESFPYAWALFVPFILVATFTMLNLFIAIIVNAMHQHAVSEQPAITTEADSRVAPPSDAGVQWRAMRNEIRDLRRQLAISAGQRRVTLPGAIRRQRHRQAIESRS